MVIDRILVSVSPGETRIAELSKGQLVGLTFDRAGQRSSVGDIFAGRVEAIIHNLQAAFIDIGAARSAYLGLPDVRPHGAEAGKLIGDYLVEGDAVLVQVTRDPEGEKGAKVKQEVRLTQNEIGLTWEPENIPFGGIKRDLARRTSYHQDPV